MASAGRRLEDDEIVSYMLTGLDEDYESVVSVVATLTTTKNILRDVFIFLEAGTSYNRLD
jgi:hypothetical protein